MVIFVHHMMDQQTILFVINPTSGNHGDLNIRSFISQSFGEYKTFFLETEGENDKDRISKNIAQHNPDVIVACGGDGTIRLVAESILDKNLVMGILPIGSANGMATELGIPIDIPLALSVILQQHVRDLDVLLINDKWISLHLSDFGLNARLVRYFEKSGQRGKLGYARHFIKTLFQQKPVRYYFKIGQKQFNIKAQMVAFANARMYGTGAMINPEGILDDRKFEVCIFKAYPWYALFGITFRLFAGGLKRSPYVNIKCVTSIDVTVKKPEILQIDGEDMGELSHVFVTLHEKQLKIIAPKPGP